MRLRSSLIAAAALVAALAAPASSFAGQALILESDQSQLVILPSLPGSVVIGNPTIADATVEGTKLFLHGRAFGTTNIMVMDMSGNEMANFEVSIGRQTPNALALFRGAKRESYNCAPYCESELQIGDDMLYNAVILEQTKKKIELATGADTAKSEAPPAPQ